MYVLNLYSSIIHSGIKEQQTLTFSDKLKSRNKLAFVCIAFSLVYFAYFLKQAMYTPFLGISCGIIGFVLSIYMNSIGKYTLSSILIILNTNYCVLFFSTYMGLASGIHLYLFTSPLIVLTAFDTKNVKLISFAMSSYLLNYLVISIAGKYFETALLNISADSLDYFYFVNFTGSLFILMILSFYFLYNNNKTNELLVLKNEELSIRQSELAEENKIRKEAEKKANEALAERELLLSEIHHRVKNNLAVVSGLLELHTVHVQDTGTLKVIKESQNRIKSIAILHEKLYENKSLKEIEVKDYVGQLLEFISNSFFATDKKITFKTQIEPLSLEMPKALPFGLLLNELISNSYKHAFKLTTNGNIFIRFIKTNSGYELLYKDNGTGFEYVNDTDRKSFGLTLIETFSKQLNGRFIFESNEQEMIFNIRFS